MRMVLADWLSSWLADGLVTAEVERLDLGA